MAKAEEQSQSPTTTDTAGSKAVRRTRRTPDVPSNPPPTRVTRGRTPLLDDYIGPSGKVLGDHRESMGGQLGFSVRLQSL